MYSDAYIEIYKASKDQEQERKDSRDRWGSTARPPLHLCNPARETDNQCHIGAHLNSDTIPIGNAVNLEYFPRNTRPVRGQDKRRTIVPSF